MSSRKFLPEDLEKRIKTCPSDFRSVENLLKRARKDLSSAALLESSDPEAAYTLLYDCMLHAGLAMMTATGARPDVKGKHKTVIEYTALVLGKAYEEQIRFYDRMRRQRHLFIYEPGPHVCTEKEIKDAAKTAGNFLSLITQQIKEKNPQKELILGDE